MKKRNIEDITRYFTPYTNDCFSNALGSLLLHYRKDPDLLTADYLGFLYDRESDHIGINYPFKQHSSFQFCREELNTSYPYLYFFEPVQDTEPALEDCCADTDKVVVKFHLSEDTAYVHQQLKNSIDQNIPAMIGIDLFYMPYHKYFGNRHTAHYVIVTGYDDEQEMYSLFDTHRTAGSNFQGELPYSVIREARSSCNPQFHKKLGAYERPP